jgi:hypothetical protein
MVRVAPKADICRLRYPAPLLGATRKRPLSRLSDPQPRDLVLKKTRPPGQQRKGPAEAGLKAFHGEICGGLLRNHP